MSSRPCEICLVYQPRQARRPVVIGRTSDPTMLRSVGDQLRREATLDVEVRAEQDPVLALASGADRRRLETVLEFLMPDDG